MGILKTEVQVPHNCAPDFISMNSSSKPTPNLILVYTLELILPQRHSKYTSSVKHLSFYFCFEAWLWLRLIELTEQTAAQKFLSSCNASTWQRAASLESDQKNAHQQQSPWLSFRLSFYFWFLSDDIHICLDDQLIRLQVIVDANPNPLFSFSCSKWP